MKPIATEKWEPLSEICRQLRDGDVDFGAMKAESGSYYQGQRKARDVA